MKLGEQMANSTTKDHITLESIKKEQSKLAEMITKFESAMKEPRFFEYQGVRIPLADGERYVGTIISACGTKRHHTILLPGEIENSNWKKSMEWAAGLGGDLPDRIEQALLYANLKEQFEGFYYWSNTQHAAYSDGAWFQGFDTGGQYYNDKSSECGARARAVRRVEI
jgi:hypothetical protein